MAERIELTVNSNLVEVTAQNGSTITVESIEEREVQLLTPSEQIEELRTIVEGFQADIEEAKDWAVVGWVL